MAMRWVMLAVLAGVMMSVAGVAKAEELGALPAGGEAVLGGGLTPYVNGGKAEVREAGGGVYSVKVSERARFVWDVGMNARTAVDLAEGDVVALEFVAEGRGGLTSEGLVNVVLERSERPHDKSMDWTVSVGPVAKRYVMPFTTHRAFRAGAAQLSIRFGDTPQTLTIRDLRLVSYGKRVKLSDLPVTRLTYPGMEADAAWRTAAAERIEKLRKAELVVKVVDEAGRPVEGAEVKVEMTRHAFRWGTCVPAARLFSTEADDAKFREVLLANFNYVTLENDLKWGEFRRNPERAVAGVNWLRKRGMEVRGHNLIWPGWKDAHFFPREYSEKYLEMKKTDPDGAKAWLRKVCAERVVSGAAAVKGKVVDWDVVNEPYANHDVMDELGWEVMGEWFRLAKETDPAARLFLNDYGILEGGGRDVAHIDHFFQTIKTLKDSGAPIDGIGIQGHWGSQLTDPEVMLKILDRYATLELPIQITEFDVNIADEATQAAFTRDAMTVLFSHPSVDAFVMWGFWEKSHWMPKGAMLRPDWSEKPNYRVWRELVHGAWWTRETVKTDARGEARVRGFKGTYTVTAGGKKLEGVTLADGGAEAVVRQ